MKRRLAWGVLVSLEMACGPSPSRTATLAPPRPPATPNTSAVPVTPALEPDLELHWAGVTVYDLEVAYELYAALFDLPRYEVKDWVKLREREGMTLELFRATVAPDPRRAWGAGQAVRLGLMTKDLAASADLLRGAGASVGVLEQSPWGDRVEVTVSEGIRWTLVQAERNGPRTPYVGLAEIKAADVSAQRAFYTEVMGLPVTQAGPVRIVLSRHAAGPYLVLVPGGARSTASSDFDPNVVNVAVFLSFQTHDIHAAARYLEAKGTTLLSRPAHYAWGGTMFFVADADANPIQIVKYD